MLRSDWGSKDDRKLDGVRRVVERRVDALANSVECSRGWDGSYSSLWGLVKY